MAYDLIIRGGTVVDGTGAPPVTADVAVDGDRIAEVGRVEGRARREIDADGLVVTPGFVDIHTHLDAQMAWDPLGTSASWHGVTSVVLGNCGVTFAPVAPGGKEMLAEMMESVEDIPASSILEGLSWNWETYGDYLDELDRLPKGLNVGGMVGHCAVRLAAMGERAMDETPAAAEDIEVMATMVDQALASGALGFSTSRTLLHTVPDGRYVPGTKASADELMAFADVLRHRGGIFEVAPAYVDIGNGSEDPVQDEVGLYADISRAGDCDVSMALTQVDAAPDLHRNVLAAVDRENAAGARLRPQTTSRQIGILFGLDGRTPFDRWGSWQSLADLPLGERVARLRDPVSRATLLADAERSVSDNRIDWNRIYPLSDRPVRHVFAPEDSVAAIASQRQMSVAEAILDLLVEMDGRRILTWPILNQDLDEVLDMLS
ncbi:MAG: amidohydrolase family protein, partial [Acidimicrobiales bacterium]|nr:amidohydrolase family protein [Acidimicrobiales bacterium]